MARRFGRSPRRVRFRREREQRHLQLYLATRRRNRPSDEVIRDPFSFIASATASLRRCKPVFVDICPKTLNALDRAAERPPRTKAILAVGTFGNPYMDLKYADRAADPAVGCCEAMARVIMDARQRLWPHRRVRVLPQQQIPVWARAGAS